MVKLSMRFAVVIKYKSFWKGVRHLPHYLVEDKNVSIEGCLRLGLGDGSDNDKQRLEFIVSPTTLATPQVENGKW